MHTAPGKGTCKRGCMRSGKALAVILGMVVMLATAAGLVIVTVRNASADEDWRRRPSAGDVIEKEDIQAEIAFGREVAARLIGRYRLYENDAVLKYVNLVGRTLTQNSNRPEIEFHFAVLDTPEINAYAAPGGYVFVTKGALEKMQDESELAGVIAHEIAHISEKHVVKELKIQGSDATATAGLARLIGGTSDAARSAFAQAVDKALDVLLKDGYKREDEVQADRTGISYAAISGYDPLGLPRFLERIASIKAKPTEILDKTHPGSAERVQRLKAAVKDDGMETANVKLAKERFAEMQKKIK